MEDEAVVDRKKIIVNYTIIIKIMKPTHRIMDLINNTLDKMFNSGVVPMGTHDLCLDNTIKKNWSGEWTQPIFSNSVKDCANLNYYWTHGCDVKDWHTSQTYPVAKLGHIWTEMRGNKYKVHPRKG